MTTVPILIKGEVEAAVMPLFLLAEPQAGTLILAYAVCGAVYLLYGNGRFLLRVKEVFLWL